MITTTNYLTKYGFTLPEVFGKIDNLVLRQDGYINFDLVILATPTTPFDQALKKQSITIPYQKSKDFVYSNNDELIAQIDTWILTATEPKDIGSGIEEVKVLSGVWEVV